MIQRKNRVERRRAEIGEDPIKKVCTRCAKIKDKNLFLNEKGKLCKKCLECRTKCKTHCSQFRSKKKHIREEGNPFCEDCLTENETEFDWNAQTGRWMTRCRRCTKSDATRCSTRLSQNREERKNGTSVCNRCDERDEVNFVFDEKKYVAKPM